jgi:hypothetical protein
MLNAQRIKTIFPAEWAVILEKCTNDPELIEICEDLDRLAGDLETAETDKAFMSESLKADVLTSMEALVEEVREKLNLN